MFENLPKDPAEYEKRQRVKEQAIGLAILILFVLLSYAAGRSDGYSAAEGELPQLKAVSQKIDRIEKAMMNSAACSSTMLDAAREQP